MRIRRAWRWGLRARRFWRACEERGRSSRVLSLANPAPKIQRRRVRLDAVPADTREGGRIINALKTSGAGATDGRADGGANASALRLPAPHAGRLRQGSGVPRRSLARYATRAEAGNLPLLIPFAPAASSAQLGHLPSRHAPPLLARWVTDRAATNSRRRIFPLDFRRSLSACCAGRLAADARTPLAARAGARDFRPLDGRATPEPAVSGAADG
jgi:hypothetical protein